MSFRVVMAAALMVPACGGGASKAAPAEQPPPAIEPAQVANQVGMAAADFTVKDEAGNDVTLAEHKGKRAVMLAFYPKDFTGG